MRDHDMAHPHIVSCQLSMNTTTLNNDTPTHLTAQQIMPTLRSLGALMSKTTLSNTLNMSTSHILILHLSVDESLFWLDSNVEPHYHSHHTLSSALIDKPVQALSFISL